MFFSILLVLLVALVAFLYASVGHGGASGYLAVLTLLGFAMNDIKSSALVLNIIVSAISFYYFFKEGFFDWKLFWPFAILSVPLAFLGALFPVSDFLYKRLLGLCLLFPILKLVGVFDYFLIKNKVANASIQILPNKPFMIVIGAIIGLLSGMLGIGGGIILSPIILLFGWAGMKQTAAVSALFILVNSIAGLFGVFSKGVTINSEMYIMISVAIFAGLAGGYFGSRKFNFNTLRFILAFVLTIASVKLIIV